MSRIRTVKPEFWASEQLIGCSPLTRLLFIGLWNFCDDAGIHPASYVRLKAEVFPVDNFSIEEIKKWITELIENNLLREYAVDGKSYWIVTGWKSHQKIEKPTYRHPLPQSNLKMLPDSSANERREIGDNSSIPCRIVAEASATPRQPLEEDSPTTRRIIAESSVTESNGMESKGKEKEICEVTNATSPVVDNQSSVADNRVKEIFQHWQQVMNHPHAKLDNKRAGKIKQALKLGYSLENLKQAIDGCANTPFNMGENDRKQRYDDITLILRDASHIENFMQAAVNPSMADGDIFAGVF